MAMKIVTPHQVMSKEECLIEKITVDAEFDYKMDKLTDEERAEYDKWLNADNPFDLLTDSERADYDAWCESVNAQTPDPTLCKCGKLHGNYDYPQGDYHLCDDCVPDDYEPDDFPIPDDYQPHIPFDAESDYDPDIPFLDDPISTDKIGDDSEYHKRLYQAAKAKLMVNGHGLRPDSLTRRGDLFIARYSKRGTYTPKLHDWYIEDYSREIENLFEFGCTVHFASIDDKKHLRVWFRIDVAYGFKPDSECYKYHQKWLAERNNGGY